MNVLVDDIAQVVASMRNDPQIDDLFDPSLKGKIPFYLYGHKLDIADRLLKMDQDALFKYHKYPLIALLMDFVERTENGMISYNLHVLFMQLTKAEYVIEDRYAKTLKPVLYPLYEKFLERLRSVGHFAWPGDQQRPVNAKIDRPFWGKSYEQGNSTYIFNDRLDCIEITELRINKRIKTC